MHMVNAAVLEGWTVLPDEVILARILEGHVSLFEVLMRRHNERIYRAARAILRDETEAEDVMQQAYVNAYAHLRQFDGRASFATWLTRHACLAQGPPCGVICSTVSVQRQPRALRSYDRVATAWSPLSSGASAEGTMRRVIDAAGGGIGSAGSGQYTRDR